MKIITLNTWGGRGGKEELLSFFKENRDVDVFCLQEVWSDSYEDLTGRKVGGVELKQSDIMVHGLQDITEILSDFVPYFRPHHGDHYGLALFIKKGIEVKVEGEVFVHKYKGYEPGGDVGGHARNIQFITIKFNGNPLTIVNFHGLWNGKGKGDSEDRIIQSEKIADFTHGLQGEVAICGDFNLLPETRSVKIIEDIGLKNLITEFGITSTRTSHYTKPPKFADYVFVSRGLKVKEFKVLPDEVSDHAPLYLEI